MRLFFFSDAYIRRYISLDERVASSLQVKMLCSNVLLYFLIHLGEKYSNLLDRRSGNEHKPNLMLTGVEGRHF